MRKQLLNIRIVFDYQDFKIFRTHACPEHGRGGGIFQEIFRYYAFIDPFVAKIGLTANFLFPKGTRYLYFPAQWNRPMSMNWNDLHQWPRWILAIALAAAAFLLFALKRLVFHFLKPRLGRAHDHWCPWLLQAVNFPLTLLLIAGVAVLVPPVLSISERWDGFLNLAAKLIAVLAFALFVQKLLLAIQRYYVLRNARLRTYAGITGVAVSIGVYSVFILIFLDTAGISITPLVASLGVGGVAVALALQDTLSNFFSGLYVIVDQPVRVGDYVRLDGGEEGFVESIGWRSVRIRKLQNNSVVVPNSKLAACIITNFDLPEKELAVLVDVGVDYGSDLEKVERVTIEVAREVMKTVEGGVPDFEPFIRYHTFADSSINFTTILRGKDFVSQYLIKHEFVKKLQARYRREEITIPFPIRTLHIEEGSRLK
ncbi:MAG TPA: mechanosensitive ion channel protein MscS [Deltaproteobacteria bacterium]|nr:mechanosensitive ion channel protein MscS [Deltaproteobacteria bacterium]